MFTDKLRDTGTQILNLAVKNHSTEIILSINYKTGVWRNTLCWIGVQPLIWIVEHRDRVG